MKQYPITSVKDAADVIKYYNGFHDGLIKRIELKSKDTITRTKCQIFTGLFDVVLTIAHYNYNKGKPPYNQRIILDFSNAQSIQMDFADVRCSDWNINLLHIEEAGDRMLCVLQRNQYDGHKWSLTNHRLFQFERLRITEK